MWSMLVDNAGAVTLVLIGAVGVAAAIGAILDSVRGVTKSGPMAGRQCAPPFRVDAPITACARSGPS